MPKLHFTEFGILFYCPGCGYPHNVVPKDESVLPPHAPESHQGYRSPNGPRWVWNGDKESPTFTPSILCQADERCHSYVTDGKIRYLPDSTHALSGQTIDIPEFQWGR
jgi:hypothetical protein